MILSTPGLSNPACLLLLAMSLLLAEARADDGASLAERHCASCHLLPATDVLPRDAWPHALNLMGLYFGYDDGGLLARANEVVREVLFDTDRYPDQPIIPREEWQAIRDHYESAPGAVKPEPPPAGQPLTLFDPRLVSWGDPAPVVSLVKIPDAGGLLLGDARHDTMHRFDPGARPLESLALPGSPVHLDGSALTLIGSLTPSNRAGGALLSDYRGDTAAPLLSELHRPVQSLAMDYDGDGDQDYLVCEFGHYRGRLAVYETIGQQPPRRHVLSREPGAVAARHFSQQGAAAGDLLVLNAQAREGITLYRHRSGFDFSAETLLEAHPGYGYTDLHVLDLNGDGREEVLTLNGDNGDLPGPPLKPYHGLRIYRVEPGPVLKEALFLPLPGAFRAVTGDFDADGDADIAAVAFFPDPRSPEQGFVYFENLGELKFRRRTLPQGAQAPWMTIAAGDFDRDGDLDLALGAGHFTPPPRPPAGVGTGSAPAALLLLNRGS